MLAEVTMSNRLTIFSIVVFLLLASIPAALASWDVRSDTWVGADALGRKLPTIAECGPQKPGKTVGLFYFLWHGTHGTGGPYDIPKIMAANPANPQWGPVHAFHHWSESEWGYYLSLDAWVMRKHVAELCDAGVDMLVIDVTNAYTYHNEYMLLCSVLSRFKAAEGRAPRICFMANSNSDATVMRLYNDFYAKSYYPDLWFRWQGKPLIMASPDTLPQKIKDFFTFRQSWAWHDPNGWYKDGKDKWPWLDYYPQAIGWHVPGKAEMISVTTAQHPTTNTGRSYHNGKQPEPADWRTAEGLCYKEQWDYALKVDPEFVFVGGWNEWCAMRFLSTGNDMFLGKKLPAGETYFVDAYTPEYSRDIEPMKGGHSDNYYYQMISNIRRYKGVRAQEPASKPASVRIDGNFDEWTSIKPEYRDHIGDTEHRASKGWGNTGTYTDTTGRNDFVRARVARDAKYIYFYVETKQPITSYKDPNWMMLFINADQGHNTGWNGYDLLVNWPPMDASKTSVKRNTGGWNWKTAATADYRVRGNKMEVRVPCSILGKSGKRVAFDFHWADNIRKPGDITEFVVSGDSAPSRRFNYRYDTGSSVAP